MIPYVNPGFKLEEFNCPHCKAYSDQYWQIMYVPRAGAKYTDQTLEQYFVCRCRSCGDISIWDDGKMFFPKSSTAPLPHDDMPDSIKPDFKEAREVLPISPRAACALLRLCVEKLCDQLVPGSGDLNEKIKKLVEKDLDKRIQKALDSVRVIGGEAIHPLQMDLKDDQTTANSLFEIVNVIINSTISKNKKIDDMFEKIPDSKKQAIENRDNNKQ